MTDIRDLTDPSFHPIDYRKLEMRTLARARQASLVQRWRKFLAANPHELTADELESAEADAYSPDWIADPVSALDPDRCEEFRAISKELARLYTEDRDAWAQAYRDAPPLFRAACSFGESIEAMREAAEEDRPGALVDHLNQARGAWFFIATLAGDASQ